MQRRLAFAAKERDEFEDESKSLPRIVKVQEKAKARALREREERGQGLGRGKLDWKAIFRGLAVLECSRRKRVCDVVLECWRMLFTVSRGC